MGIPVRFLLLLFSLWHSGSPATARPPKRAVPLSFDKPKTYIVHVHRNLASSSSENPEELEKWYKSFLPSDMLRSGEPRLIHSYTVAISGFAARLTEEELWDVKKKPGFIHAYPDRLIPLQTTRTPAFLGLWGNTASFWNSSNYGEGVIIGVLDSGISPDHPSFRDEGMPPPPPKWKGACDFSTFKCNNKLIGARYLVRGWDFMHKTYDGGDQEEPTTVKV